MSRLQRSLLVGASLFLVPLLWFAPVVIGGRTLLPADNLYQFEPWASQAATQGITIPHNQLLSDLVLQNFVWKTFLRQTIAAGELPLWNPYLFSGVPFLAAGQHSALYPLSIVFLVLPLPLAYGVFTWLQLGLAGLGMFLFARSLRLGTGASLFAGLAYAFSGFLIVSVVFPMIIAAASWLPWIMACIEIMVRKQEERGDRSYSPVPYVIAGAIVLGLQVLAGHPEIVVITLLAASFYAAGRLLILWYRLRSPGRSLRLGLWLVVMVALGLALGAVQLIPLLELANTSFRQGSASYDQVVGWAWPARQIITFFLPDFFGNPSHHGWFDPFLRSWRPAGPNAAGQPVNEVFWGVKNYVEGGNYLGILTLVLAVVAVGGALVASWRRHGPGVVDPIQQVPGAPGVAPIAPARSSAQVWLLALLAVASLLFAFGTPLYAVLFYGVPGYKQLHSAFRWVFPYTLAMTALAGFGLQQLVNWMWQSAPAATPTRRWVRLIGSSSLLVGVGTVVVALASLAAPGPLAALGQQMVDSSDLARNVFADGADFWSYQWRNVLHFGAFAALAGLLLLLATRRPSATPETARPARFPLLVLGGAIALLLLDLFLILGRFNAAADPAWLKVTPPSVAFLQQDTGLWRVTSFEGEGTTKTLNANLPWLSGMQDVRGYDSIIPRQYVGLMESIEPQGQLLYNRISPFYDPASLDDPLTDLLGIKYVMSELPLAVAGWDLVYDDEVKIYRNDAAFPRAFLVGIAEAVAAPEVLARTRAVDLQNVVVLELGPAARAGPAPAAMEASGFARPAVDYTGPIPPEELPPPASPELRTAQVSSYGTRQVLVDVNLSDRGWLVLADAWFPGWKAYLRPFGAEGEGIDAEGNPVEQELPIFRANGGFRAVYLPAAGQWTVRFVYSPRSVQLGIYASFLAAVTLMLLAGWWAWGRFYREVEGEGAEVRTVAKNSSVLMALSLLNRGIDFAFAMLRLRVLGPYGEGSYAFVIAIYGFFEVVIRFGLGTLLTRDVAQDRQNAGRYLTNVLSLRLLLWLLSLPALVLVAWIYASTGNLSPAEAQALALFAGALLFASLSDSLSSVFMAFEKMEVPAGIATAIATAKVALGALVLLPPFNWGFVGLAGVSLVMNVVQCVWLWVSLRRHIPLERAPVDWSLQRSMARESYPLMLNHLLASIFWRIDLWLLKLLAGTVAVGIYSAGVKYLDGFNVIPSYFTLAIFPLMSRYARDSHESLVRAYKLAVRLLIMVALPIAISVTVLATPLIRILGGAAYLPDSAIALTILIWSIPVGFVNSVTQYVLIAVGQQRFLTKAFVIGVSFNVLANLLLIPRFGYRGAAVVTVFSEISLLIPFYYAVRRHVAPMPWFELLWRPLAAAAGMGLVAYLLGRWPWLATGVAWVVYGLLLFALGTFRDQDLQRVWRALPLGRRKAAPAMAE